MAYELIRVSELAELSTPADVNVLPIQAGDTLKKITFANLKDAAVGGMEGSLAAAYDSTATYAVGDYCIYEGQLYRCTTAITTAEAWTAGHWTAAVLTDDIASDLSAEATTRSTNDNALAADIAEALGDLAAAYSTSATYAVGDYCIYQGQLYRCTTAITTAEAWTSGHWSAVALADDTRDLKSALNYIEDADSMEISIDFSVSTLGDYINRETNKWATNGISKSGIYELPENSVSVTVKANNDKSTFLAFLQSDNYTVGTTPSYSVGTEVIAINAGETKTFDVPRDARFIYFLKRNASSNTMTPSSCVIKSLAMPQVLDRLDTLENNFENETCVNLFNKADAVYSKYINPTNGNEVAQEDHFYVFVKIESSGTYRFYGDYTLFGSAQVKSIPVYDSNGDYITYITGTHFGDETSGSWYGIQFSVTNANITSGYAWFALTQRIDNMERFMVVKDTAYPSEYIPYFADRTVLDDIFVRQGFALGAVVNRLYGKTACFFGDSICNGNSAKDNKNGWAGRIGDANSMNWWNYGVNGGTITEVSGHHFIGGDIELAYTDYSDADFLIIEGGTNDADTLHEEGIGTFSESDFSGSYDTTTFSGAFETLIYKAITYFPHSHIGYIVAPKMGTGTQAEGRKLFFDRAIDICEKWGIPALNLWTETRLNPFISVQWDSSKTNQENIDAGSLYTDGQHLTPSGYDLITPIIYQWILGI